MPKISWYYLRPTKSRPTPAFMCSDGKYYAALSCEHTIETIEKAIPEMLSAVKRK